MRASAARKRLLVLSTALALGAPGLALARASAQSGADWSLCRANDWLDFYVPELTTTADRETAETLVDANQVDSPDGKHYVLDGDVVIVRADQRLAADHATYDQDKSHAEAEGAVRYQDKSLLLSGDKVVTDLDASRSVITPARYQLVTARGNGDATKIETLDPEHAHLVNANYSTCELGSDSWRIYAKELWLDQEKGVGRARGMKVELGDVPILYLPYARFPIDDRRQSGFLYPSVGGSGDAGIDVSIPYYLNLAPNYDATITPRIVGQRGVMLGGEFRYLRPTFKGEWEGTWLPDDDKADRTRGYFRIDHLQALWPGFVFQANVRRVTDTRYFEDFGNSLNSAATSYLPSSIYLLGRGAWWNTSLGADRTQLTDPLVPAAAEPYERLPRFTLDAEHSIGPDWLAAGLRTELVHFDKDDAVSGERYDWYPYLALPFETAAWFVRPEFGYRYTSYNLDRQVDDSPTRELPIASLDAGVFAERAVAWFGHGYRQTLEPRIYYLYVPDENQDDLPIFDTQELTFGFAELFRPNRFSGADRQTDANQLTLALSSRLIEDDGGRERARLSLGQIRYFDPPEVEVPGVEPLRRSESAFVGELEVQLNDDWSAAVANQYDPKLSHTDFGSVRLQRRWGSEGVANLDYRYRREQLEQLDLTAAIPIDDNWKLVGRYDYSLKDSKVLEAFAGFEYDSCCYAVRLVGRHYLRNVEGESNDALYVEIELKGLGGFGRKSEEFLRKAIQGYR